MRVLSIDTSGRFNAVGLIDGQQISAELVWEASGNSLQDIILNIDRILDKGGLSLADVDVHHLTDKPLCGISSFDALAYQAGDVPILLCPLVDAGRGNVYAAFYRSRGETLTRVGQHSAGPIEGLLKTIKEPVLFLGDAVSSHRRTIAAELGPLASFANNADHQQSCAIALLALSRFERGESDDVLSLVPLYLKEPLAQALLAQERRGQTT